MYVCSSFVTAIIVYNKNVDIKFSAHDAYILYIGLVSNIVMLLVYILVYK
jgi:hypothetical protein